MNKSRWSGVFDEEEGSLPPRCCVLCAVCCVLIHLLLPAPLLPSIVLSGYGFGVNYPEATLQVRFGGLPLLEVTAQPGVSATGAKQDETATFILPESFGERLPVSLVVTPPGGAVIESNVKRFTYSPPNIHLLTTEWEGASKDLLLITLRGASFCKGTTCGTVYVDGLILPASAVRSWSHSKVVFVTTASTGDVAIKVGSSPGQSSNSWPFAHLSPKIDKDTVKVRKREAPTLCGVCVSLCAVCAVSLCAVCRALTYLLLPPFVLFCPCKDVTGYHVPNGRGRGGVSG